MVSLKWAPPSSKERDLRRLVETNLGNAVRTTVPGRGWCRSGGRGGTRLRTAALPGQKKCCPSGGNASPGVCCESPTHPLPKRPRALWAPAGITCSIPSSPGSYRQLVSGRATAAQLGASVAAASTGAGRPGAGAGTAARPGRCEHGQSQAYLDGLSERAVLFTYMAGWTLCVSGWVVACAEIPIPR